jgi:hypothetical protein
MSTDFHLSESVTISAHQWLKGLEQNRRKDERSGSISAHRGSRAQNGRQDVLMKYSGLIGVGITTTVGLARRDRIKFSIILIPIISGHQRSSAVSFEWFQIPTSEFAEPQHRPFSFLPGGLHP